MAAILDQFGRPVERPAAPVARQRNISARYDAAMLTEETRRQWSMADGWQADALNSPGIRRILRNRCRYETANNSYARGITLTLANDTIGTGPRLCLNVGDSTKARRIQAAFTTWAREVHLGRKLRTMRMARCDSGEQFLMFSTNPNLNSPVKLDLKEVEADQISTTDLVDYGPQQVDGIRFDDFGNPTEYHLLKYHPGTLLMGIGTAFDYDKIPASQIVHYFRPERPSQRRGIPEITPALLLFLQLRRYTKSVLDASENAADFSALLYTDTPADGEAQELSPLDRIEITKRMMTTLPGGWKMEQLKAEQPTTTYPAFKDEILKEIARCLNMPFNVAAGDSSKYNYASGRLDHQTYFKSILVDRGHIEETVLSQIFWAWVDEAALVPGLLPDGLPPIAEWGVDWAWPSSGHVDPEKERNAQQTGLANNTTNLQIEWAREGRDWEDGLRQRAREMELIEELGLTTSPVPGTYVPPAQPTKPIPKPDSEDAA